MSLQTRLEALAAAVGADFKQLLGRYYDHTAAGTNFTMMPGYRSRVNTANTGALTAFLPTPVYDGLEVELENTATTGTANVTVSTSDSTTFEIGGTSVTVIPGDRWRFKYRGTAGSGAWQLVRFTSLATPNTNPRRNAGGTFGVGAPTASDHPATKLYADTLDTEIAYAENNTGTATAVSGNLVYSAVDGCAIVIPPQTTPWEIEWEAGIQVGTAGGGALYVALMELPIGGGTATLVKSAITSAVPTNSGTYSKLLGNIGSTKRFAPTTVTRQFYLALTNLLDSSSGLTSSSVNTAANPSWIGAKRL